MKIALDLRPRSLVESQRKKRSFSFARFFLVLFFLAFLFVGGTTLFLSFMNYRSLDARIAGLEEELALKRAQSARLANELKRLAGIEATHVSALKMLQEEVPALEFLQAMEGALPLGVWMRSVSVVPGRATLQGTAFHENDVVEFAKGLLDVDVVATVDFPTTTRVQRENQSLVDFSLSCRLRDFAAAVAPAVSEVRKEGETQ
jgi:Tfp pilus assembly protein PilN